MLNNFTKLIAVTVTSALLMGCASLSAQTDRDDYREQAIEILESVPLFDGHNDAPLQYRNRAGYKFSELDFYDTTHLERSMHTDIERLREGRVGAQWWSVYVSANLPEPEAVKQTMEQVEFVHRMAQQYPDVFEIAHTADDVERIFAEGKIASLMGMEGGHSINNSLGVLRMFHELGVRYMTLTHGRTLDWADAAGDEPKHDGLSAFGEEVVREMNRLGMAVDLSHVTPATMKDAIRVSEAPVMFSHSNARAISNHPRNVPDDVLQLLPQKDGLVMVTFVESFTSEELRQWYAERSGYMAKLESLYPGQPDIIEEKMDEWTDENEMPKSTLEQVADHIDHIRDQVGVDHIGIGGDYDGISSLPTGLDDVSTYPNLFAELLKRGYSEEDLRKIAGENMLRVMRGVEETAERLQNVRGPSEALITDFD
ncbi:dipeptidase [Rhodohalobacter barkolensis]|uniref:Membrane dipeptidase n=1 Tax=Rhodohalobacter barkolensis TaxID=2053187 RepID=A0A2N0VI81_9BACT|nr:dipeptidase [Rhodohalobacter barkolensis]PKD43902.1 membrane dipeptidase [Rhodohalobacter barkolensis]